LTVHLELLRSNYAFIRTVCADDVRFQKMGRRRFQRGINIDTYNKTSASRRRFCFVLWEKKMEWTQPKYLVLGELVRRVAWARGSFLGPLCAIAVSPGTEPVVQLVDVTEGFRVIGRWRISSMADVPDAVRALKRNDPYLAGCVYLEEAENWLLVDDATLEASMLFSREWRLSWGQK